MFKLTNLTFQAYIFDIRSGTYSHKLTGHTDVVSDVDFHPLTPQVCTAHFITDIYGIWVHLHVFRFYKVEQLSHPPFCYPGQISHSKKDSLL